MLYIISVANNNKHEQRKARKGNTMNINIIVFHDNGVKGQRGYTEYSAEEIAAIGGVDALVGEYMANGIVIYEIF